VENKSGISNYTYYPNNLRYTKDVNGTALCQVWDGSNLALEYTSETKAVVRRYIRGINLISMDAGANKSYYLFNAHGDVVQLTDAAGAVIQTYDYDAFGNQKSENLADSNPFRYCGEYYDAETGTIYLRARYYDPSVGRFTRQDPAKDGLNWYTYCNNNPIIYSDPNGHFAVTTAVLVATGAAILIGGIFDVASGAAGVRTQAMYDDPSLYNIADWATMGTVDMVKGAFAPENPLSFKHWMDSFGTVTLAYGAYANITRLSTQIKPVMSVNNSVKYGPMNKGPLPDTIATTFRSGTYSEIITQRPTTLYRVYGGKAGKLGSYWTTSLPQGPVQSIIDSALNPAWGNTATNVAVINVPKGVTMYLGYAEQQGGLVGGGIQVFIERVNPEWLVK